MTTDEKTYLITLSQLKELTWTPDKDKRVRLFTDIVLKEHKPMGPVTMIFVGIGDIVTRIGKVIYKGLVALIQIIDKATEPQKKRGGKP